MKQPEIIQLAHKGSGGQRGWVHSTEGIIGTIAATDYKDPKLILESMGDGNDRTTGNTAIRSTGYSGPRHNPESTRPGGDIPDSKLLWGGNLQVKIFDYSRFRVRKLTPTEYGRLQGFPMNTWRQVVSNSQAYKQFGNAVTVPLAEAIGKSIIEFLNEQEAEDGKDTASRPG